jgi:hypothetical protein
MYYGTPPIVTNGLIYNLDSLNSLCVNETPTVNQYLNPEFINNTSSWQFSSWDNLIYTYEVVNGPGPNGNIAPLLKVTRISGSTGPAHFHQGNGGKYTTNGIYTPSAYVSGSGSFAGRHQALGVISTFTLTNTWQRVEYTFTQPNNTQYPFWAADNIAFSQSLYFTLAQSERLPYASSYVSGSRLTATSLSITASTSTFLSASVTSSIPTFTRKNDRVLNFDGTGSYTLTPGNPALQPSSSITLEALFQRNSGRTIISYSPDSSGAAKIYSFEQSTNASQFQAKVLTSVNGQVILNGPILATNTWYHAVMTYDGSLATLYINGVPITSSPATGSITYSSNSNLNIGRKNSSDGEYISGQVQVTRVYNRGLSQQEITQNYNALKGRFGLQ